MFKYVLKRIFIFIPTLIIISLLVFALSKFAPGDPVELRLGGGTQAGATGQLSDKIAGEKEYFETAERMGLDIPNFYFDLKSKAYPDTLYKVGRKYERKTLKGLCKQYGNWPEVSRYYKAAKDLEFATFEIEKNDNTYDELRTVRENCNDLYRKPDDGDINRLISGIKHAVDTQKTITQINQIDSVTYDTTIVTKQLLASLNDETEALITAYNNIKNNATTGKRFIPSVNWHGFNNQYHVWLFGNTPWIGKSKDPTKVRKGFFRFDFGESYRDGRSVWLIIKEGVWITMGLNIIALILVYLGSIPLGVSIAIKKDTVYDRIATISTFILYALPSFWIATMLIIFFTNDEYGMNWFPSFGLGTVPEGASFFKGIGIKIHHLILPIFCMVYGGFAFLSRQMRGGMLNTINMDFIRTARSKGLSENKIIWKHGFRNSLIPIITIFASLLPGMIGGSIILEVIFSIPGMGKIAFESVVSRNFPVLFTIVMFSAILTVVGILISDIVYAAVDPRISFTKKA